MTNGLTNFAEYLTWSNGKGRCPLAWKTGYVLYLKSILAPILKENEELAAVVHKVRDAELTETLFCPRVLWALTQTKNHSVVIQEMLSELQSQYADGGKPCWAGDDSHHSKNLAMNMTSTKIAVDFESSFELPGDFHSLVATPSQRRNTEYERIDAALEDLQQTFPAVFEFVADLTTRIAIRFRPDRPRFMLFGSFTEYPGLMLIVNPWQTPIDSARMIDAIVHENIHHAIAMFETVSHDLTEGMTASSVHQSPWTGNFLTTHQFVEACFVWWGLYQMWLNWPLASCIPQTRSQMLRDRALSGFLSRPVSTLIAALGTTALPEDTIDALFFIERAAARLNSDNKSDAMAVSLVESK